MQAVHLAAEHAKGAEALLAQCSYGSTWQPLRSSFLVMIYFLFRDNNILPKKELHASLQVSVQALSGKCLRIPRLWDGRILVAFAVERGRLRCWIMRSLSNIRRRHMQQIGALAATALPSAWRSRVLTTGFKFY